MATIYYTSDMHSYLYDTDYVSSSSKGTGYFNLARHFDPSALIIDGGDVLQGSPFAREISKNNFKSLVQAEVMNAAHVQVFVPGNHDFNFGSDVFCSFVDALDAALVCANLHDASGKTEIHPYHIHTASDGTRIGVVGVVTDYVNIWEDKKNLGPLLISDCVEGATKALKEVRSLGVEYTVCVYHGGFDTQYPLTPYRENRGDELAKLGFDILLTAHQHNRTEPHSIDNTLTLQCGSNATLYAKLECNENGIEAQLYKAQEGRVFLNEALDSVQKKYLPLQQKILSDLGQQIGKTEAVLRDSDKTESAIHGSSLADFFNEIQLSHTGADLSCVALFNYPRSLGPVVTAGDVIATYPFPNTLVVLEVDGIILKKALERCASYFELDGAKIIISKRFLEPKVQHYNYDYYQNLEYEFDLSKPLGQRVVKLEYHGKNLLGDSKEKLTLVMNNYRATGTGGYEIFLNCPVVKHFKTEVQELIFSWFLKTELVKIPASSHFLVHG